MDRLSSCYFCGAALDESLAEYPVVPDSLRPATGTQKTVVLCGTCRRKLDAVLDTVVGAVEERADAAVVEASSDATDDRPDSSDTAPTVGAAGDEGTDDVAATLGDDEDILQPVGSDGDDGSSDGIADAMAEEASTESDESPESADAAERDESGDGEKERKYTESRGAGWQRDDDRSSGRGLLSSDSGDSDGDESESAEPSSDGTDESAASGGSDGEPASGGASAGESADDAAESDDAPEVSLSRLENTKVMRLLENREFPVDAEEFVTVATNAYQISREDCEKVLSLANKHDLIHVEDGQIRGGSL